MTPMINPPKVRELFGLQHTLEGLRQKSPAQLKHLHNAAHDFLCAEGYDVGDLKRRRKWADEGEAVRVTWKILGIANGEIDMTEETTTTEKPTPKCYSAELVKRPTRKMFMRIKKVGEPNKSQRPFAWGMFKDGMRLVDIKEDPNLHAGKITFWMRQDPPLIALEDISDEQFQKELDAWYADKGLENPDAAKLKAKAAKAEAAAARAAEREAKKAAAAEKKAANAEAKAKAAAEREKAKEAKAAAKAEAGEAKKAAAADKKAAAAAKKTAPAS